MTVKEALEILQAGVETTRSSARDHQGQMARDLRDSADLQQTAIDTLKAAVAPEKLNE